MPSMDKSNDNSLPTLLPSSQFDYFQNSLPKCSTRRRPNLFHKTSLPLLAPAAPLVKQAPKPPIIETSYGKAAQQPHAAKRSLPRLAPAAPRMQMPPYPPVLEPSCTQPTQQPHGTKRSLPRLAPTATRVQTPP